MTSAVDSSFIRINRSQVSSHYKPKIKSTFHFKTPATSYVSYHCATTQLLCTIEVYVWHTRTAKVQRPSLRPPSTKGTSLLHLLTSMDLFNVISLSRQGFRFPFNPNGSPDDLISSYNDSFHPFHSSAQVQEPKCRIRKGSKDFLVFKI